MTSNDKSNGPGDAHATRWKELSLEELLKITTAGPSYDDAKARRAIRKIVAGAERFCDEVRRILLKPHETWEAERHDGLMEFIACASQYLEAMGEGREVIDKLAVYYAALDDLDVVAHPMFEVKNGGPSVGSQIWRLRGMSAVAVEYQRLAKEPVVNAAKKVAGIPGLEKLLSGRAKRVEPDARKTDAYTSVLKWRKTARGGKKMNETLRMVWASRKTFASIGDPQLRKQEFRKEATRLIEKIRRELGTLPPGV